MKVVNSASSIIIRASWVYSEFGNNFVKTMLQLGKERERLSVVCDQIGTPTNAKDLAELIIKIIPKLGLKRSEHEEFNESVKIYHYSSAGVCSWYDFAISIFEINNVSCRVDSISSEAYPTPVKRPYYSVMDKDKIEKTFSIKVPHWCESLK